MSHTHRRKFRHKKKRKWYKRRKVQYAIGLGILVACALSYFLITLNDVSKEKKAPEDLKDQRLDIWKRIRR